MLASIEEKRNREKQFSLRAMTELVVLAERWYENGLPLSGSKKAEKNEPQRHRDAETQRRKKAENRRRIC
jgi:hypothetical protein